MSWVRVWIHTVFTTKNRAPLIQKRFRQELFNHIKDNAIKNEIVLIEANGYIDHAHCLFSLNKGISISKTLQLIKGESSHWINKEKLSRGKFSWQDDFWAVGVGESYLEIVKRYIQNQEEHHKKMSFNQEVDLFFEKNE